MSIFSIPVDTFKEYLLCDDCSKKMRWDEAIMQWNGMELLSSPPQYQHKCPKCGKRETKNRVYPRTIYKARGID